MNDSFTERMRKRALERLERNAHVLKSPPKVLIDQCITKAPKQTVNEESKKVEPSTSVIESAPKILTERSISKRTPVLDQAVVKTLESQGYTRTDSDAHLYYDFKQAKNNFNKENMNVNAIPKPKRQFDAIHRQQKSENKEVTNLYSNLKYQTNVFIQNSRKIEEESNSPDPCLLSVAERRKLFEKRLVGGDNNPTERVLSNPSPPKIQKREPSPLSTVNEDCELSKNEDCELSKTENEYSTYESDTSQITDDDVHGSSETPTSEGDISSEHEAEVKDHNEADVSVYPILQTVKQVKFVSTPKPGRLYPSVSDLDGEVDEDPISKHEASFKTLTHDDSFGREVLCATNSIFSSFQNSRKDTSDSEKSRIDALAEVKELINPDCDTSLSLSLSPVPRMSVNSIECANETASFTFMKAYSNNSIDVSPIPISTNKSTVQSGFVGEDECDARIEDDEMDVPKKIKLLEEQIVKEKIILTQEIRALKYCLSTSFINSQSHLEAERLVLLSQLRIEAAQNEIQRLKVENTLQPSNHNFVRGNVVISKIKLPVKVSYIHASLKDEIENNLLCIIKSGDIVLATDVVPVVQSKIRRDAESTYIEFPDSVTVQDVSSDFKIRIEVYNLVVDKKDQMCHKNKDGMKKDKKIQNLNKKNKRMKMFADSYSEEKKTIHSSFSMIGYMIFSQNLAQRHQWMLNKYQLPLVGMIIMELKCNLAKITVQKHGFLTMYEIISGYGAWCRYWFYLNGDKLSFWKYPEQENVQEPLGIFDLRKCISKDVVVVGYDVVFRPQTFTLKFSPLDYLQQFKGLTEDRLLLSADNEEERISWCECLNEVLSSVRSWSNPNEKTE